MQFELTVDPEEAVRLARLPALSRGRTRPQKQRIIWHDSIDRTLAQAGLSLAEERGSWRLERLYPGLENWPPGSPAPILAEGSDPMRFGIALPDALGPAAAVEGQTTDHLIETDHGRVEVRRFRGVMRTVAAERPIARLLLSGEEQGILAAALRLSQATRVEVPRASLAAEALAAAENAAPAARRLGAPVLPGNGSIAEAFAHAVSHLTDVILHYGKSAGTNGSGPETIHQMRVAVRRLRSTCTVFRPAVACDTVDTAMSALRDLANALGPAREWDVFMTETAVAVTGALPDNTRLQRLLAAGQRRRKDARGALRTALEGPRYRQLGIELAWLAGARSWQETLGPMEREVLAQPLSQFAASSLQRRLKKLRGAAEGIEELEIPALHDLRLRAKRLRYAAETLGPLFPPKAARRFIARLSVLQARLGILNDGAVAADLMDQLGGPGGRHAHAVGLVLGFIAAGTTSSRSRIVRSWDKFSRQPSFWT